MIEQFVILCGGLGSRLGELTRSTPKPLLPVACRPFLEWLVRETVRQGARRILLLAAFEAPQVREFAERVGKALDIDIQVAIEPERAGTGGALWHARQMLEERFILMNGDSLFDVLLADLARQLDDSAGAIGVLSLREVDDASRYGVVELDGGIVTSFSARPIRSGAGLVNGGVYAFRRQILDHLNPQGSLEADVLPGLALAGKLRGRRSRQYFIDIGVPDSYALAQTELPARLTRPAVFFDRDGVLNVDHVHVGRKEQFEWQPGAREAVRAVNAAGYLAFIVTNQAGIGKGLYSEEDFKTLMAFVADELFACGAHIDDIRYCPHHPEAVVEKWRKTCDWRKPGPGMLLDLLGKWDVDRAASFLVGDKQSDITAARSAGMPGFLFPGGNLLDFLQGSTPFGERKRG
jgi:D-glycero-D-manno-heptose 1,7-bisphosphate phosphatase